MARLLVDGYNVIRRDPTLAARERQDASAARAELVRLLGHHSLARYQVVVVFDGAPPPSEHLRPGRVRVIYSHARTADEVIADSAVAGDVVVTDDRGLSRSTLPEGPQVWSVAKLLALVRPRARQSGRLPAQPRERPVVVKASRLRRFDACARCLFASRDDWIMLCEEDSALRRPKNFRESW